jgi:hypothetical protein
MRKHLKKEVVALAALTAGLACGAALAAPHDSIVLRDPSGAAITAATVNNAFSMKMTCGAAACHDGTSGRLSYDQIERHNYHAQIGSNEIRGFNPWNPDSTDAFRTGAGPVGKNWVQSPGHIGSW